MFILYLIIDIFLSSRFSINFVNEICKNPDYITYHFKWLLDENFIVENYKDNGNWVRHEEHSYDEFDGVFNNGKTPQSQQIYTNNSVLHYSVLGSIFELEFAFQDGFIDVYKIYENTPNRITSYEPYLDITDIKSLQVWGDVMKISEISYKYA